MIDKSSQISVGVAGVGSMGANHARVYESLPDVNLVGVTDVDQERAAAIAQAHGTRVLTEAELTEVADAISICVPTRFHHETAHHYLNGGCDVLVEKPFVRDIAKGEELIHLAEKQGRILQVGHVERFNPAVQMLNDVLEGLNIVAFNAERLGPPLDRHISDNAILDLMIHDIDIVVSLAGGSLTSIGGAGVRENRHVTATLGFEPDIVAELTASRLTQEKVRKLDIVAEECLVRVDYIDRSIAIHRASTPEYIRNDENIRYRHESIVERPMIESSEPLRNELSSFVETVQNGSKPVVSGEDGLVAVWIAKKIESMSNSNTGAIQQPRFNEVTPN
jgi:predicted dehydrogenase